ncbi:biopolymer transporter ExbD [Paremcibacter congregatus]|uniref:Biopolymer transporter ExbD n=2 Tax=Paremcibacter congregatus TaxID=2043170 RepID=A0A2G4YVF4_9PROT|nr:biopolymer transporter ExbD [Paremcibacter congregatus]QDE29153.1 biopolymer transporter ExbD [Paremcibacter congregatus]
MTPMLDIVFIMLIFFIVTASFLKESGLPLNVPENSPPTTKDRVSLILQVSESNEVLFGARRIDIRAVGANLKRKMSELDNPSVVVRAHPGARTDTLMQVVDRVHDAGVHDFIVSPIKE